MAVHYDVQHPRQKTFSEILLWTLLCDIAKVRKNQTRNQQYTGFSSEDLNSEKSDHFFKEKRKAQKLWCSHFSHMDWTSRSRHMERSCLGFDPFSSFWFRPSGPQLHFFLGFLLSLCIYLRNHLCLSLIKLLFCASAKEH